MNIVFLKNNILLISLLLMTIPANAATNKKSFDPLRLPINEQLPLNVYWKERGGQILIDSVCFNYPEGSSEKRGCRKLAVMKFREECQRFDRLYQDSRPYYDKEYKEEMEKFCQAADSISPE